MFDNESPLDERDKDILKDIQKGVRLKHVRTNDRSKPNLRGIRSFKRQLTKEEKLANGFSFEESIQELNEEEDENVIKLQDDLESTKQVWSQKHFLCVFFFSFKNKMEGTPLGVSFCGVFQCLNWS